MRRITLLAAGFLLLLCSTATGQELTSLPEPGKLLGYVSSPEVGKWIIFGFGPQGFKPISPKVIEGGTAVLWQGDAGEYAVYMIPPGDAQPIVSVVVLGKKPDPDPDPDPNPVIVPVGKYGIGPNAYKWASSVAATHRSAASQLADNFEAVAAGIAAGSWRTPQESNKELTGRNRAVLGADGAPLLEAWRPWFVSWQGAVDKLIADGKLPVTVTEYRILYLETAAGLKAVK